MTRTGLVVCLVLLAVQGSRSVIWPCEESRECSDKVEKAQCSIFGFCQCPAGHVFSAGVTSCLPESAYGVACQEAVQCSHMLTGARCEAGVCTCDGDYTYVRGRCRKLVDLGQPCSEDIDCFFSHNREAVVCRDGTCDCADGFYRRSSNVCRRRVINGELCLVHQDCDGGNLRCENQVCTTTDAAAAQTKTFRDVAIQTVDAVPSSEAHQEGPPPKVDTGTDMRPEKPDLPPATITTTSNSEGTGTAKRVQIVTKRPPKAACAKCRKFGDACVDEGVECPDVPYSVCRMGQCLCKDGYYHADGLCMAELGEYAHQESYCPKGSDFRDHRCTCPNNNFYDNNMRSCLKPAQGINTSCTQQSQCSPYGLAYCPAASPKRCTCHPYAEYDEEKQMCVEKQGHEAYCEKDADCTLANTRCTPQKTCVCQTNYFYVNERCMAASGSPCQTVADCAFDEAECTGDGESESEAEPPSEPSSDSPKRCRCKRGYLYQSDSNRCLKEAEQYEDECSVDEQCQPLLGELGQCIEGKCQCNEAVHHYKDGKCNTKIALDERCGKSSECFVEDGQDNVECRNSACQCKFDYSPDVEQQKCIRPSGKNSSDRPSALKVITLMLTSAAVLITGSALRDAYYA
ncbi:prion-like-(Q/N-rich) domain-bearing protein 25 isoform X1 [Anopheles albimanus]|uniref:prion-like-(Q/N-rich) domain-bearing protein 25 isoform X1 n=2 Tax=Anopheles albimanus TaxID=7167 RepID=UPI0016419349|nr:prion-like-(Q/N-rich) domain-bearing protein 25 isoform X1 [Anopheles albimanus]